MPCSAGEVGCVCGQQGFLEAGLRHLPGLAAAAVMVLVTGEVLGIREQWRVPGKASHDEDDEDGRTFRTKSHKLLLADRYHQAVCVHFHIRM